MKNMKRVLSAVMAATTVCAMSASAIATGAGTGTIGASTSYKIEGQGTTKGITLSVTVPNSLAFTIDPYGTAEGKGQVYSSSTSGTANYTIDNASELPVNVMVTSCKGTLGENSKLKLMGATPPEASSTSKQAQLFLRAEAGAAELDTDGPRYRAATAVKEGDVLVSTSGSANALLVTLPAGANNAATTESKAAIGITGVVSTNVLWETTDNLKVEVAFNIVPQPKA